MRPAKDGSVVIRCRDKEVADKIKDNLESQLGNEYTANIPKKRCPQLKVIGIESGYDENTLLEAIKNQNKSFVSDVKVKILKKMVNKYFAILECDPVTFRNVMSMSSLSIGFKECPAYEFVSVIRCYRCCQYNHLIRDCPNNEVCGKCSRTHATKDCNSNVHKCVNCTLANQKTSSNSPTDHTAFSIKCSSYLKMVITGRAKVDYDTT